MFLPLGIIGAVFITVYYFLTRKYDYWKKKNVPHPKPRLLLGNYGDFFLMKKNLGQTVEEICKMFPKEPLIGVYYGTETALIVKDPELIKLVFTKDFYYFSSRELNGHTEKEPGTKNLFNHNGDYWKVMRQNLTPIFSSAKMKNMFYLIQNCSDSLEKFLKRETSLSQVQEVRNLMGRFTMDCMGSCIFGLQTNAMGEVGNTNVFRNIANAIFDFSASKNIKLITRSLWPNIFYGLGLRFFSGEVDDFFKKVLVKVFEERDNKPSNRNDFIDFILGWNEKSYIVGDSLKNNKNDDGNKDSKVYLKVDNELLAAQSLIFFAAGFETSATTSSFTLFELAKNKDIQDRVVEEVDAFLQKHDNKVTYECTSELPYLEACIDEAMRIHPVFGVITRELIDDYTLPSGIQLDKGLRVHLPTYYLHHNPNYFPEPSVYRPERFLPENKDNIKPYTYFPFGEGPRICIGMRFAKMQMMAGLITLFKLYRVELADGMASKLKYEPKAFISQVSTGINLKFIPRTL